MTATPAAPLFDFARFQQSLATRVIGRPLIYRESIGSTMDTARREMDEGAPSGTIVLAEEQTAGRGRQGRAFLSPPGENLYFTLVLRVPPTSAGRLTLAVPAAVALACGAVAGVEARIKWPNDIWIGERKTCGMLLDAVSLGAEAGVLVGIGINVNGDPTAAPELRDIATSLRLAAGTRIDREMLLATVCNRLEPLLDAPADRLSAAYREESMVIGRTVTLTGAGTVAEGEVIDIDTDGSLVLRTANGAVERFAAGAVSLRPKA